MKRFTPYTNIRKQATILGLPLALFALLMISIIACLLVIIFSFSLGTIVAVLLWNALLYLILTKLSKNTDLLHIHTSFPSYISNQKFSQLYYEDH